MDKATQARLAARLSDLIAWSDDNEERADFQILASALESGTFEDGVLFALNRVSEVLPQVESLEIWADYEPKI